MREYDLEEILAEYAEKDLETAQPEEESVYLYHHLVGGLGFVQECTADHVG